MFLHGAEGIKEARIANLKMDRVAKRLNLRYNEDKTFCLAMGSRKQLKDIREELEIQPLMCGNFET